MPQHDQRKRHLLLAVYAVAALPFIAYGATQALSSNANSPIDWVSPSFPSRREFDEFGKRFGSSDVVLLSWPGCTLDNAGLDRLADDLRHSRLFFAENGQWYFDEVVSGRDIVRSLTSAGSMPPNTAIDRLSSTWIGPDRRTTWLVVRFTPAALAVRDRLVPYIRAFARRDCGVGEDNLHLAGPVIDGLSVDAASKNSLRSFGPVSAGVVFLLAWWCLGSMRAGLLVFGLSLYGQALTLGLIHFGGQPMNALMIVLPPLIQVLAIAAGIHLVNYYEDAAQQGGRAGAAWRALRAGWLPCVLSAATTAIGLASLLASNMVPLQSFGVFGAVGVLATAGLVLLFIPSSLAWWDEFAARKLGPAAVVQPGVSTGRSSSVNRIHGRAWDFVATGIERHWLGVTVVAVVAMVVLGCGAARLTSSVRIETLFGKESRILKDYAWLEQHVGPTVPIEVVVRYDEPAAGPALDRLRQIERIEAELDQLPGIHGTMSASTLLPPVPSSSGMSPLQRKLVDNQLSQARQSLIKGRYLDEADGCERWRVTATLSALDDIDYGALLDQVDARIGPLFGDGHGDRAKVGISYTGIMPLVHRIQHALMRDLFVSFLWAFALITAVIVVVQSGLMAGLIAMVPNVFPPLLLFGLLGWLGRTVDIGSVMTASVALGVAVDDTLHFMTFFRRAIATGATPSAAVRYAYRHCGLAMVQTTLVCSGGMLMLAFSNFVPAARFAWMLVALMLLAIVGDLIVLPALLLGPAGRFFVSKRPTQDKLPSSPPPAPIIPRHRSNASSSATSVRVPLVLQVSAKIDSNDPHQPCPYQQDV